MKCVANFLLKFKTRYESQPRNSWSIEDVFWRIFWQIFGGCEGPQKVADFNQQILSFTLFEAWLVAKGIFCSLLGFLTSVTLSEARSDQAKNELWLRTPLRICGIFLNTWLKFSKMQLDQNSEVTIRTKKKRFFAEIFGISARRYWCDCLHGRCL